MYYVSTADLETAEEKYDKAKAELDETLDRTQ